MRVLKWVFSGHMRAEPGEVSCFDIVGISIFISQLCSKVTRYCVGLSKMGLDLLLASLSCSNKTALLHIAEI
jgi:hypothetical protein